MWRRGCFAASCCSYDDESASSTNEQTLNDKEKRPWAKILAAVQYSAINSYFRQGLFSLRFERKCLNPVSYCAKGCRTRNFLLSKFLFCDGVQCCCCLHIKPFFLPKDISSTPSVRPDSSSYGDTNSVVTDSETENKILNESR